MVSIINRTVDPKLLAQVSLSLPECCSETSELMWTSFYNMLMVEIKKLCPRINVINLVINSNVTDSSATGEKLRPDGLLVSSGRLLFVREDKRVESEIDGAIEDLRLKHRSFQAHLYGVVDQIFCMATAGTVVRFFTRDLRAMGSLKSVSEEMDLVTKRGAILSRLFNIFAWAGAASRFLPNSRVLSAANARLVQPNVFFSGQTSTISLRCHTTPGYAHKTICVPDAQYKFLSSKVYVKAFNCAPRFAYASSTFVEKATAEFDGSVTITLKITPVG